MLRKLTQSKAGILLLDQAVYSGTSFLLTIVLANLVSVNIFGEYAAITLAIFFALGLWNALIINPLQVSIAKITDKKQYTSFVFWMQAALILISLFGTWVFQIISGFQFFFGIGLCLFVVGFGMHDFYRKMFIASNKLKQALIIDVITSVGITFSLGVCFITNQLSIQHIYFALGCAYIPSLIVAVVFSKPFYFHASLWKSYISMHFKQGKWLFVTAFIQWWGGNLFVVASGVYLGVQALGALRLAQSLMGVLNVLLQTFENYVLPKTAALMLESQQRAKHFLRQVSFKTAFIFALVLGVTFLFSNQIMGIAGGEPYIEYGFVLKGLCILYMVIFLGYPVRIAIRALVLNSYFLFGYIITLVFALSSSAFLLANYGLYGAITGLIISQILALTFWQVVLARKKFNLWKLSI